MRPDRSISPGRIQGGSRRASRSAGAWSSMDDDERQDDRDAQAPDLHVSFSSEKAGGARSTLWIMEATLSTHQKRMDLPAYVDITGKRPQNGGNGNRLCAKE